MGCPWAWPLWDPLWLAHTPYLTHSWGSWPLTLPNPDLHHTVCYRQPLPTLAGLPFLSPAGAQCWHSPECHSVQEQLIR